jgi:Mrp family chromosome partitioning ATPase
MGQATLSDAIVIDQERGLHLLLNKRNYTNSTDIVSSDYMSRLIAVVRSYYDFIIIDSPPMSLMADAEVLADQSDMSVLVVKYDTVLAQDLNDAIDSLRDCHAKFAGCILNQVRTLPWARRTVGGYGGYGRYGRYGHYGRYGRYGEYGRYGKAEK